MAELKLTTQEWSRNPRHVQISVWQNGGLAGKLTVEAEHAEAVLARIEGRDAAEAKSELLYIQKTVRRAAGKLGLVTTGNDVTELVDAMQERATVRESTPDAG